MPHLLSARLILPLLRAVLVGLPLVLAACESAEERLEGHLTRGTELLEEGEIDKAALEFRNALQIDNENVAAHMGLARVHESKQDFPALVARVNRVIELDPTNAEALTTLGQVLLMAGQLDQAFTNASSAVDAAPNDPTALALKAGISLRLGNNDQAVELARQALAIQPGMPVAGAVLVGERVAAGDTDGALEYLEQFIEQNPETLSLGLLKLQVLDRLGDDARVEAYLKELIGIFPEQRQLRTALVRLYLRADRRDEAETELRAIAASVPGEVDPALDVVRFAVQSSGAAAGRTELERLIAERADPFPFEIALAQLDWSDNRGDEAEARIRRLTEDETLQSDRLNQAQLLLARFRNAQGDKAETESLVAAVLEADGENIGALGMRATLRFQDGDYEAAILDVRKALGLAPDNVALLRLSAQVNLRNGNPDLAGERYGAAVEASGYEPSLVLEYVRFLNSRDRRSVSLAVLDEASRRHPRDRELLAALASEQLRTGDWIAADRSAARLESLGDPENDTVAQRIRAASLSGREQYSQSIAILRDLAEEPDSGAGALASLVQVYIRSGQSGEAAAFLEQVLADNPKNVEALLLRATLYISAGDPAAARGTYRQAIEARPDAAAPYLALARLDMIDEDQDAAVAVLDEGIGKASATGALRLLLAGIYERALDYDAAIAQYEALYAERPGSAVAANNLASLLAEHRADDPGALTRAEEIARPLRGLDIPAFQDTYGWIVYLGGDPEQALRWLRDAAAGLPDNPYVRYHAGVVYAALGDEDQARSHLEAALALEDVPFSAREQAKAALDGLPAAGGGAAGDRVAPASE